jgi:hypothetical protein
MADCEVRNCHSWSFRPELYPVDKANTIADCIENQFTPHNLCEENHERQVVVGVQALLEAEDSNPMKE